MFFNAQIEKKILNHNRNLKFKSTENFEKHFFFGSFK